MCTCIAVKRVGQEEILCFSVGELADALNLRPIEISPDTHRDDCLCNARLKELNAKENNDIWPEYVIEVEG